jgi:uncharacterized protein (DUF427 family)
VFNYPQSLPAVDHVEFSPRRVRGIIDGDTIFDTTNARYVWEWPHYPQYYIPVADVVAGLLVAESGTRTSARGTARRHGLRSGAILREDSADVYGHDASELLRDTVRFDWDAIDAWFEEDERIFKHPRDPYSRVDAVRSTRTVRIELDSIVLAESSSPVLVFETGLPTRYYLNRSEVNMRHLEPSDTSSICPYKGTTSGYWSVRSGATLHADLAWCYDYPVAAVLPIAGLIAFYNEKVDVFMDGHLIEQPRTHFFDAE